MLGDGAAELLEEESEELQLIVGEEAVLVGDVAGVVAEAPFVVMGARGPEPGSVAHRSNRTMSLPAAAPGAPAVDAARRVHRAASAVAGCTAGAAAAPVGSAAAADEGAEAPREGATITAGRAASAAAGARETAADAVTVGGGGANEQPAPLPAMPPLGEPVRAAVAVAAAPTAAILSFAGATAPPPASQASPPARPEGAGEDTTASPEAIAEERDLASRSPPPAAPAPAAADSCSDDDRGSTPDVDFDRDAAPAVPPRPPSPDRAAAAGAPRRAPLEVDAHPAAAAGGAAMYGGAGSVRAVEAAAPAKAGGGGAGALGVAHRKSVGFADPGGGMGCPAQPAATPVERAKPAAAVASGDAERGAVETVPEGAMEDVADDEEEDPEADGIEAEQIYPLSELTKKDPLVVCLRYAREWACVVAGERGSLAPTHHAWAGSYFCTCSWPLSCWSRSSCCRGPGSRLTPSTSPPTLTASWTSSSRTARSRLTRAATLPRP